MPQQSALESIGQQIGGASEDEALFALWDSARRHFQPFHERFADNIEFVCRLQHYANMSDNVAERDRRRIKYRGRELFAKRRRKVAQISPETIQFKTRPLDPNADAQLSEGKRWILENEVNDPRRHARRQVRRCVDMAVSGGAGALALDVDYDQRPYPLIILRAIDPRDIMWTPGWLDPDDITCPWVMHQFRMTLDQIARNGKRGWKNVGDVEADDGRELIQADNRDASRSLRSTAGEAKGPGPWKPRDKATGVRIWFRQDGSTVSKPTQDTRELAPVDRYLACPQCGYQEHPASGDGSQLTDATEPCPICGAPLGLVKNEVRHDEVLRYPDGLEIIYFPLSKVVCYRGPWQIPSRQVPRWIFKCYDDPLQAWGLGDGDIDRGPQVVSNSLMRRAYETATGVGGILAFSEGLKNPETLEPFEFTDEPVQLALWTGQGSPGLQFFNAGGQSGALLPLWNAVQQNFRTDMGTGEIGIEGSAEQLKGVAVGTVQTAAMSGEIPIKEHKIMLNEILSDVMGVWDDYATHTYTEDRLTQLMGSDGRLTYQMMRASQMPLVDVEVSSEPGWNDFDSERISALTSLMSIPDPAHRRVVAEIAGMPSSVVDKLDRLQQAQPVPPGAPPGQPPVPGGPPQGGPPMQGA